jgi:predicted ATPase
MDGEVEMPYLHSFCLSHASEGNPNIYPYNIFAKRQYPCFTFEQMTVFYGANACGKSSLLNIIANALGVAGAETTGDFGGQTKNLFLKFVRECSFELALHLYPNDELFSQQSRYIKSEDLMYEVKKIQQNSILKQAIEFERLTDSGAAKRDLKDELEIQAFAQEKFSNGEQALMLFDELIQPNGLYLLDEPEVSLSPQNQIVLANKLNDAEHYMRCQFIIATHSPLMLGTLNAKIYDLDTIDASVRPWHKLQNVRFLYDFFKDHSAQFD